MVGFVAKIWNDESGATAIEYALVASFIGMAIVSTASLLGTNLNSTFQTVKTGLE